MVHTTMEENILEGTLYFLSEFVSCQHCPPKEIICHLIRQILLDTHEGEILKDIYMLLMKIQMYVSPKNGFSPWGWLAWRAVAEGSQPPWRWEIAPAVRS